MAQGSLYVPPLKIPAFWNDWKGVKNPHVLYVIIAGVMKDTRSSWLEFHNLKSIWMAQGSPYVPLLKILAFWNNWKGVKNPHVLYVIIAGVMKDPKSSLLEFHNQKSIWMAQWSPYVPRLKILAIWSDCIVNR